MSHSIQTGKWLSATNTYYSINGISQTIIKITVMVEIRLWRTQEKCQETGTTNADFSIRTEMLVEGHRFNEWLKSLSVMVCCLHRWRLFVGINVTERRLASGARSNEMTIYKERTWVSVRVSWLAIETVLWNHWINSHHLF